MSITAIAKETKLPAKDVAVVASVGVKRGFLERVGLGMYRKA